MSQPDPKPTEIRCDVRAVFPEPEERRLTLARNPATVVTNADACRRQFQHDQVRIRIK